MNRFLFPLLPKFSPNQVPMREVREPGPELGRRPAMAAVMPWIGVSCTLHLAMAGEILLQQAIGALAAKPGSTLVVAHTRHFYMDLPNWPQSMQQYI